MYVQIFRNWGFLFVFAIKNYPRIRIISRIKPVQYPSFHHNHRTQNGLTLPNAAPLATLEKGVPDPELVAVLVRVVNAPLPPADLEVEFEVPAPDPVGVPDAFDPVAVAFEDTLELSTLVGLVQFSVKNT